MERLYEITPEIRKHILSYLAKETKETFTVIYGARLDITCDVIYDTNMEQGRNCTIVNHGKILFNKEHRDFFIKTLLDNSLELSLKESGVLIVRCSSNIPEVLMAFMQITDTLNVIKQDNIKIYVLIEITAESEKITKNKNSIRIPIELPEGSKIWENTYGDMVFGGDKLKGYRECVIEKIGTAKVKLNYGYSRKEVYLDIMQTGGDYCRKVDLLYSEKEVEYFLKEKEKKDKLLKIIRSNVYSFDSLSVEELEKIATILTNNMVN